MLQSYHISHPCSGLNNYNILFVYFIFFSYIIRHHLLLFLYIFWVLFLSLLLAPVAASAFNVLFFFIILFVLFYLFYYTFYLFSCIFSFPPLLHSLTFSLKKVILRIFVFLNSLYFLLLFWRFFLFKSRSLKMFLVVSVIFLSLAVVVISVIISVVVFLEWGTN